jgi:hypothetical protein
MRALVVTNMYPSAGRPALGSFVRDQVWALRRIDGLDVQVHAFSPVGARSYLRACRDLRRRCARLAASDPGVQGRARALAFCADAVAQRVAEAWRRLASRGQAPPLYSPAEAPPEALRAAPPS